MAYRCAKCGGDGDLSLGGRHDERGDWIPVFVEGDQPYGFQGPCGDLHVFVVVAGPGERLDEYVYAVSEDADPRRDPFGEGKEG